MNFGMQNQQSTAPLNTNKAAFYFIFREGHLGKGKTGSLLQLCMDAMARIFGQTQQR